MEVWRLASSRYDPLSGEGARLAGGRWNSPGHRVVYTSESLALCVLEALVHITGAFPADYQAVRFRVPDRGIEHLDAARLGPDWADDAGSTREIGDRWLQQSRSLALCVPSAVVPSSTNVLLNPLHRDAEALEILGKEPFRFDPRLRL